MTARRSLMVTTAVPFLLAACAGGMEAPEPSPVPPPGSSVLAFLDPGARDLPMGATVEGTLNEQDYTLPSGQRIDAWRLQGTADAFVSIDLTSDAFDAFLRVLGPGLDDDLIDDDSGGGCNARISFSFPETARYLVIAQALGPEGMGPYTLRTGTDVEPPLDSPCNVNRIRLRDLLSAAPRGTLGPDDVAESRLNVSPDMGDTSAGEVWELRAAPGTTVTVDLRSDAFDAYLYVDGPGLDALLEDDDGGGQCHSRITFDVTSTDPYTIVASGLDPGAEGPYTLITSTDPGPPVPGDCGGGGGAALDLDAVPLQDAVLTVPGAIDDALADGDYTLPDESYTRGYEVDGPAGACVVLDLTSDAFDTLLFVTLPGYDDPLSDDDSGDDTNSRLQVTLPAEGAARAYVNSFGSGSTGPFRLAARTCDNGG